MKNKCVIYARFSTEDELREGKSRSITNQVQILKEYADEQGFIVTKVYEDYMYSGRDFNRPAVKELIKAAMNKEFDILLLKDLSRLGRNYIDVGTHLEKTFLGNGIRVIALNDFYDSNVDFDYLTVALKNYLNEYYIRDVSKKIIRVTLARSKYEFLGNYHYGYIFNNKKISIYQPEADVVKRVFKEVLEGKTRRAIAKELENEKIPRKQFNYKIKMGKLDKYDDNHKEAYKWDVNEITKILTDIFYTGTAINFKSRNNGNKIDSDPIILENNHEAIISKKDFLYVNSNLIRHQNLKLESENVRGMIYCKKCLARYRYNFSRCGITPTIIDGKEVYHDYRCRKSYPIDILNRRIYDMLLLKHKHILDHKHQYIENIISEKYNDATTLKEIAANKKRYEKKGADLFEDYVNGKITQEKFSTKMVELNNLITECDKRLSNLSFDECKYQEVESKVNEFLNNFQIDDSNMVNIIIDNIAKAIYDPEKGSITLILKFEEELDIPSLRVQTFIKPELGKRSEWDLDDIVYKIVCDKPHLKTKDIYTETKKIWEGFTFKGVERSIRSLRLKNMIKFEGKSDLVDGYVKIDYEEDFDYHNLDLNRKEKDVYRIIWYNPKMSYKELSEASNMHIDNVIKTIRKIRRQGGFEYPQFDKNYVPEGALHSIFVEDKRAQRDCKKEVFDMIEANPDITIYQLYKTLGISDITARKYYRIAKGITPNKKEEKEEEGSGVN